MFRFSAPFRSSLRLFQHFSELSAASPNVVLVNVHPTWTQNCTTMQVCLYTHHTEHPVLKNHVVKTHGQQILTVLERARCLRPSHARRQLVAPCTFLHTAAPLTSEVVACVRLLWKPQPPAPAARVHRGTLRFLTLTHTAYGACPNCSRLRARRLENPPKRLSLLSLLEGFFARCCDCAG